MTPTNPDLATAVERLVRETAMSLPPSDFGSTRAIRAMTKAFLASPFLTSLRSSNGEGPFDREHLAREVRVAWVRWAEQQPDPKPSWLVPYDGLSEPDKEADRQIGEHIQAVVMAALPALSTDKEPVGWREALTDAALNLDACADVIGKLRSGKERESLIRGWAERCRAALATPKDEGDEEDCCPICDVPFKPDDICASDVTEGTCHAECLEGADIVDLDTEEPSDGPIFTYRYDSLAAPKDEGGETTCPTCRSPDPSRHPAVQCGGEVAICSDPFHALSRPAPVGEEGNV